MFFLSEFEEIYRVGQTVDWELERTPAIKAETVSFSGPLHAYVS
jgi:hypothetical protein